jgi:hypothetical protein
MIGTRKIHLYGFGLPEPVKALLDHLYSQHGHGAVLLALAAREETDWAAYRRGYIMALRNNGSVEQAVEIEQAVRRKSRHEFADSSVPQLL